MLHTVTEGIASCEKTEGAFADKNVGVGAGIALGITGNTVEAVLGENATITGDEVGGITVNAASTGMTEVTAAAGADSFAAVSADIPSVFSARSLARHGSTSSSGSPSRTAVSDGSLPISAQGSVPLPRSACGLL